MKISWKAIMKKWYRIFFEVDVLYSEKLLDLHNDLSFLPERMKIEKLKKLVINLHDKTEYVDHLRNLKQTLNNRLKWKKVHRMIKSSQKSSINTDLRKAAKMIVKRLFQSDE